MEQVSLSTAYIIHTPTHTYTYTYTLTYTYTHSYTHTHNINTLYSITVMTMI